MKSLFIPLAAVVVAASLQASPAKAVIAFDQDVTNNVIFGSGNANGSWTTDRANGVEVGLRAKVRFNAANAPENTFNSNGAGTYEFQAGLPPTGFGFAPGSTSTATWNFEWSINSNYDGTSGYDLDDLSYVVRLDFDRGPGTSFLAFDQINLPSPAFGDHAIGDNTTANGAGISAGDRLTYETLLANNNLAQNSWNMEFFDDGGAFFFDGSVSGEYEFQLEAFDNGVSVAMSTITVSVVPEPSAFLFGGLVCGVLGWNYSRKRK